MNQPPIKLTVLVTHPIQYYVPVYRELARRQDLDFTVLYQTRVGVDRYFDRGFGRDVEWDIPLLDGYRWRTLSSRTRIGGVQWTVIHALWQRRADVLLLHGYNTATNLLALGMAKLLGTRVLMRGDTRISPHHRSRGLRTWCKRRILNLLDGCVSIGSLNADYYLAMGVPKQKIHFAPFCVDNDAFDSGARYGTLRADQRAAVDIAPDALVILFAAKLIPRKRAMDLLQAVTQLVSKHPRTVLAIAGSGPEETNLREAAAASGKHVRFVGFKNQSEMPALLAAADVFVLPAANEPWGLAINEAMAAGLPVIVSDDVGAAPDLVAGMHSGVVYPVGDVVQLRDALDALLNSDLLRKSMAEHARSIIQHWNVTACSDGIATAAIAVAKSTRRSARPGGERHG